jgi:hypothetical protein
MTSERIDAEARRERPWTVEGTAAATMADR